MDIYMRHMHSVLIIYNLNSRISIILSYSVIKLFNNRHKYRNYLLKIPHWPFFKSFCKDGMIGISTGLTYHLYCIIHSKILFLSKNSDKFRYNHSRMGIINLNYCILMKLMQIMTCILHILNYKSCSITYHKVLLIDTKKMSCLI